MNIRFAGRGDTALSAAAVRPTPEVVQLLLDKGADVNQRLTDGSSPLLHMLKGGAKGSASALLIQRGAEGMTPWMAAGAGNTEEMRKLLIAAGAMP